MGTRIDIPLLSCLLSSPLFVFLSLSIIVSYIDIGGHTALMELILPLATCHCTSHCVDIFVYYLGK